MNRPAPFLLLTVLVFCLGLAAHGAEGPPGKAAWPAFRGPASIPVGDHPNLPVRWSTTENVEWSTMIDGLGWSSPIVAGDRVFLTAARSEQPSKPPQIGTDYSNDYIAELIAAGHSEDEAMRLLNLRDIETPDETVLHYELLCLDLETGELQWKRELFAGHPPGGRHRKNSFASETPVTDGEHVYVYAGNLGLWAYDLNGEQLWHTPLEAWEIYLQFGTGASPALHEGRIYILNDNQENQFLAAFDATTGRELWRTQRELIPPGNEIRRSGWTTPFIWQNELGTEIVAPGPYTVISYDLGGRELWRMSRFSILPVPTPFAYQGLLYVSNGVHGDDYRPIAAIKPGARGDITLAGEHQSSEFVAWYDRVAGTYQPTPVAYEGSIWVNYDKGMIARYDAATGKRLWRDRLPRGAWAFTASPWAYNGMIFCLSEDGDTFVLRAGDALDVVAVNSLDEMALASPAIVGDRLLLRTQSKLYSIRNASIH